MNDIIKLLNFTKRNFMQLIDRNYIKKKLSKRKGKCKKCGKCCKGCKLLDNKTKLCIVYNKRPKLCHKTFPLSKKEQEIWKVKNCGYRFIYIK